MDLTYFLIQTMNGVQYGLLLFLISSGLTLIFGIMNIINLAHGALYATGAYLAYWLTAQLGSLFLAITVAIPIAIAIGIIIERFLIQTLYKRGLLDQVLLTFGLILVFKAVQSILWGNDVYSVPIPQALQGSIPLTAILEYPVYRIFVSVVCIVIAVTMYFVLQHTRLGMIIRGGASNREMMKALGINIRSIYTIVFAAGTVLAMLAGMLAAPLVSVYPGMGNSILIMVLVVVVIGGLGSIKGAFLGALLVGLTATWGSILLPEFAGSLVYLLMVAVPLFKPHGLFR